MRSVSVKSQKTILFIPVVNVSLLFIFIYNCIVFNVRKMLFLKAFFTMVSFAFMFMTVGTIIKNALNIDAGIWGLVVMYIVPLILGSTSIYFQIKY